jgi:aminopeptidase N
VQKGEEEDEYIINIKRKGEMQMPLDIEIETKEGEINSYHIPNNWNVKEGETNILHKWIGWGDRLNKDYHAHIKVPGGIENVTIDPSRRMADVNLLNNSNKCPVSLSFDHRIYNMPDRTKYEVFWRPDIWFNGYDGLKIGANINGDYLDKLHKFDLTVWYNSGIGQQNVISQAIESDYDLLSFRFNYSTPTTKILKRSHIFANAKFIDGLHGYKLGYHVFSRDRDYKTKFYTYFKSLYRSDDAALAYLLYPNEWRMARFNNTLNLGLLHRYKYKNGNGNVNLELRSTTIGSDYDYSSLTLTSKNTSNIDKLVFKTRVFGQFGFGDNWAPESQLFLASANPEELMDNKFTRSIGFIPEQWTGYGAEVNNFHQGGGLNLRGYSGYLAPYEVDSTDTRFTYKGTSGVSINAELEFDKYIKIRARRINRWLDVTTYLFSDAGMINYDLIGEDFKLANLRWDAGIGGTFTIKKWGPLERVRPLVIRIDLPLFLNRIPAVEDNYFDMRWVVGIKRAF